MKTTCNVRRKKVFPALLLLLVLTVALSVGTTLGKYYEEISISDLDDGELEVELILYDPPSGEGPGIVEETPTTVYQVQPGETLSSIAEKFHTTVEALAAYNNIADPNKIQAGMILRIPPADYVVPPANTEETPSTEPSAASVSTVPTETEPSSETPKTT